MSSLVGLPVRFPPKDYAVRSAFHKEKRDFVGESQITQTIQLKCCMHGVLLVVQADLPPASDTRKTNHRVHY